MHIYYYKCFQELSRLLRFDGVVFGQTLLGVAGVTGVGLVGWGLGVVIGLFSTGVPLTWSQHWW